MTNALNDTERDKSQIKGKYVAIICQDINDSARTSLLAPFAY